MHSRGHKYTPWYTIETILHKQKSNTLNSLNLLYTIIYNKNIFYYVYGIDKQWKLIFVKSLRSKRETTKMRRLIMQEARSCGEAKDDSKWKR